MSIRLVLHVLVCSVVTFLFDSLEVQYVYISPDLIFIPNQVLIVLVFNSGLTTVMLVEHM